MVTGEVTWVASAGSSANLARRDELVEGFKGSLDHGFFPCSSVSHRRVERRKEAERDVGGLVVFGIDVRNVVAQCAERRGFWRFAQGYAEREPRGVCPRDEPRRC